VRQGGVNLTPKFQGSAFKKKPPGRTSEEHINKVRTKVLRGKNRTGAVPIFLSPF
jgi:hypothetical protein